MLRLNSLERLKAYWKSTNPMIRAIILVALSITVIVALVLWAINIHGWNGFVIRSSRSIIDGLALSMLLFLMVSGFFLIFGLCGVINFAHGAFFMLGGFVGYELYILSESILINILGTSNPFFISISSFIIGVTGATVILALIGGGIELFTIRRLYGNAVAQILLTVGFMFIITQISEYGIGEWDGWGTSVFTYFMQDNQLEYFFVSGTLNFGEALIFEVYRIFLIFFGLSVAVLMFIGFRKTRIGLQIQAGIEDSEMVEALGTDIKKLFTIVFMMGAGLAGFSGAVLVPWIGANTGHGLAYLIFAFIIVVVGGAHYGRFEGTFFGALLIGLSYQFAAYFMEGFEGIIIFVIMAIVLIFKPGGLTGHE